MSNDILDKVREISSKYDNLDVKNASFEDGKMVLHLGISGALPEELPEGIEVVSSTPREDVVGTVIPEYADLNTIRLPGLDRTYLDLNRGGAYSSSPHHLYKKAIQYWRSKPVYGSVVNTLANFASKGFDNDIDDPAIKDFYDNWVIDVGFDAIVDMIFFEFFRTGFIRTYKVIGPYKPKVNQLSAIPGKKMKATAQRKNRYSAKYIPLAYTILNPQEIKIDGSLMFGQTTVSIKASALKELKNLLDIQEKDPSRLTQFQKNIILRLPNKFKQAVKTGNDVPLDNELIGEVDYRRMPFERYPVPRGVRAFEAIEFKDELRIADSSTLDGITNYILKITVGNDNFPITKQEVLDRVGEMFNTVSKSFKVVWDHTLNVEKITSDNIGDILGQDKYLQTNDDIYTGLAFPRALIDGESKASSAAVSLAIKSVIEEIHYARRQVTRWIYKEYRSVAEAMGFDRFPKVRFDDMALRDELAMMSIVQGMIDRRIISYRTGQKKLGFDPTTELSNMREEKPLVLNGDLGLVGSPFQQSKQALQPVQMTPKGTPSEGRPRGKPAKTPAKPDNTKNKPAKKQIIDNTSKASETVVSELVDNLSLEELESLLRYVAELKKHNKLENQWAKSINYEKRSFTLI